MDSNSSADSPWPDLPLDLILKLSSFLDSRVDRLRFRSVCKSWRLSVIKTLPPNSHLTTLQIPLPKLQLPLPRHFYPPNLILAECVIYHISDPVRRSFTSPIVGIEEFEDGRKVLARHPISGKNFSQCGKVLDLTYLCVIEVGKLFHLKPGIPIIRGNAGYRRVVVSLNDEKLNISASSDIRLMCIIEEKLMHFRLGDEKWVTITHGGPRFPYSDVIFRKGSFYAVDEARRVVIVDNSMNVEVLNAPDVLSAGLMSNSDTSYLVNYDGELYLLVLHYGEEDDIRDPFNTKFLIYRFHESERDWVRVMSLGDWCIFVSRIGSFAFCVPEVSFCKTNCIYFQVSILVEGLSFDKDDNVCFVAVFDLDKGSCDNVAYDFKSWGAVISWPPGT
ncbi:unnamed protein product [Rhodiola kirilowii]